MSYHDKTSRLIVMVVDDTPESLSMISEALEDDGMTVLMARSGEDALKLNERVHPDVILMDAVMPGLDGFETCKQLKFGKSPSPAPVIFMTGLSEPEHIVKGLEAGGVDYITKPVVIAELLARLNTHVGNARKVQSAHEALDNSGNVILAFDQRGILQWGSPSAIEKTQNVLPDNPADTHVQKLREWLLMSSTGASKSDTPLTIKNLKLYYVGKTSQNETLVRLAEVSELNESQRLAEKFNLTDREAEVLYWVSLGKTNRDIGAILVMSARTVNKHLEQVFQKLGVENRTSAAVLADRSLN